VLAGIDATMKILYLILFFFFYLTVKSQKIKDYSFYNETDSFKISLNKNELDYSKHKIKLILSNNETGKKKVFREKIKGEIKLINNDTTYWVYINDYFTDYFIGFIQPYKRTEDSIFYDNPIGYKRIRYNNIEWINSSGHKHIGYQMAGGFTVLMTGIDFVLFPFLLAGTPFYLIPVGIPLIYYGVKIMNGVSSRTYNLNEWKYSLKDKN